MLEHHDQWIEVSTSKYWPAHPWEKITWPRVPGSAAAWPCQTGLEGAKIRRRGMGAEAVHADNGLHRQANGSDVGAQFAWGAGVVMVPIRRVRPMRRSRSGMPCASLHGGCGGGG